MPFIFEWEGGYENDPDDPGGETNFGIDKRSHPEVDIRHLTLEGARAIYWTEYWQKNGCEALPYPLGEVFFNACVNCGPARAKRLLAQGKTPGGFLDAQEAFYRGLARAHPALCKFLKGWLNRTAALRHRVCA